MLETCRGWQGSRAAIRDICRTILNLTRYFLIPMGSGSKENWSRHRIFRGGRLIIEFELLHLISQRGCLGSQGHRCKLTEEDAVFILPLEWWSVLLAQRHQMIPQLCGWDRVRMCMQDSGSFQRPQRLQINAYIWDITMSTIGHLSWCSRTNTCLLPKAGVAGWKASIMHGFLRVEPFCDTRHL